jgi:hypothetical protein
MIGQAGSAGRAMSVVVASSNAWAARPLEPRGKVGKRLFNLAKTLPIQAQLGL